LFVEARASDTELVGHGRRELLDVHLDAAVARDTEDGAVPEFELDPDGGREPEAHGAEASGRDEGPGLRDRVVLRGPHLVLSHVRGDDRILAGEASELLDDVPWRDVARLAPALLLHVGEGPVLLPLLDGGPPGGVVLLPLAIVEALEDLLEDEAQVAVGGVVGADDLRVL